MDRKKGSASSSPRGGKGAQDQGGSGDRGFYGHGKKKHLEEGVGGAWIALKR